MNQTTKVYRVVGDYSYLFDLEDLEVLNTNDLNELYDFCFSKNKLSKPKTDKHRTKLVFTELSELPNFPSELSELRIPQDIYLVYLGNESKLNWPSQIEEVKSPYTKEYIVKHLSSLFKIPYKTSEYFYESCGGRYSTICNWTVLLKPKIELSELYDLIEGSGNCNLSILLNQIANKKPLTELLKVKSALDAHKGFNYIMVAAQPVLASIASTIWQKSKERGTTEVDFILFMVWLSECYNKRNKKTTATNKRSTNVLNIVPDLSDLKELDKLLSGNLI